MNPTQALRDLALAGGNERMLSELLPLVGLAAVAAKLELDESVVLGWVDQCKVPASASGRLWAMLFRARREEQPDGPIARHNGRWKHYLELSAQGLAVVEIARRCGVSHQAVSYGLQHIRGAE